MPTLLRTQSPSALLAERYELGAVLGSGGSASVFRARDHALARDVAVKVIPFEPTVGDGGELPFQVTGADVERFRREALALSRLRSRHVARVYDFGSDPDLGLFLVMELIEGAPLEARSFGRPLLPHEVLRVARGVLDALADAHAAGLVHRDIKPQNVVVPRTPNALDDVRVLDFGISRSVRRAEIDRALGHLESGEGMVLGTPAYMAPEQLEDGDVGPRADLYAAGLMLYELLGAGPLFPGDTLRERLGARVREDPRIQDRVAPPLGTLLAGMLARAPEGRFADGAAALEAVVDLDTAPVSIEELFVEARRAEEERKRPSDAPLLGESPSARMRAAEPARRTPSSPPPSPSSPPPRSSSRPPASGVAFGGRRPCRLDGDPLRALKETLHALDIAMIEALARRERGSELGRVARSLALATRLELDAASVLLEPLASSPLARAFGGTLVAPRARRVTRVRVDHDRTDVWIDQVDPELAAMLAAVAAAMTTMGDAARNESRCRRAAARLGEDAPEARTARMGQLLSATVGGTVSTSSALLEMLRLRDTDPAPPTPFTSLVRALLLGVVAFRGDEHLAREQLERATKLAADSGATLFEVRAIVAWGGMLVEIPSRVEQGLGVLERATTLLGHGDAPSLEHIAEHNRGAALLIQRRYAESAEHLHRARLAARGELSIEHEMVSCTNEAFAHTFVGAYEPANQAVAELTDAQIAQVSARAAAFAHVARSLFALVFQGLDAASAELRRALARVKDAEANGGDVALLAELLGILYASARGEPVDLLPRAAELEKLAEQHGFASLYWMERREPSPPEHDSGGAMRPPPPASPAANDLATRGRGRHHQTAFAAAVARRHPPRMSTKEHIGITGYDSFHFVVENLERSRAFYAEKFDFKEVARASEDLAMRSGQQSVVFGAGDVRVCVSTPLAQHSKAARFLRRHPAGVMSLSFRVEDLDRTMAFLEKRGGTFLADPMEDKDARGGRYRCVEIATPLGDVAFRFVERSDYRAFAPGFVDSGVGNASKPDNLYGIAAVDHVTSNGLTMQPIVGWYKEVLGMEPFWDIAFHTKDVSQQFAAGSGLKSIVMWDPVSQVKFATNEPLRPQFRESQIWKFVDDNEGPGVQHVAFGVTDIIYTVNELKRRHVEFMDTPKSYYQHLPERLAKLGITNVKEELATLEKLQILLDGSHDKYMLQIFLREAKTMYEEPRAGPFFYEIIQRAGDPGFGYGNFRALFESIERAQKEDAERRGQGT